MRSVSALKSVLDPNVQAGVISYSADNVADNVADIKHEPSIMNVRCT